MPRVKSDNALSKQRVSGPLERSKQRVSGLGRMSRLRPIQNSPWTPFFPLGRGQLCLRAPLQGGQYVGGGGFVHKPGDDRGIFVGEGEVMALRRQNGPRGRWGSYRRLVYSNKRTRLSFLIAASSTVSCKNFTFLSPVSKLCIYTVKMLPDFGAIL